MSEYQPREHLVPIVLADHSGAAPAPGGSLLGIVTRRDPMDGAPATGPQVATGYLEPLNVVPRDYGTGLNGERDRRIVLRLIVDLKGPSSTPVVSPGGAETTLASLASVEVPSDPALALRVSGTQIDPGLSVSTLLRKGWRPRSAV